MSASSFTDWSVRCDDPGCTRQVWASEIDRRDLTATALRKILKERGWAAALPHPNLEIRTRQDLCPDHKPDKEA